MPLELYAFQIDAGDQLDRLSVRADFDGIRVRYNPQHQFRHQGVYAFNTRKQTASGEKTDDNNVLSYGVHGVFFHDSGLKNPTDFSLPTA